MTRLPARYFDGHSSAATDVLLVLGDDATLRVEGLDRRIAHALHEVTISERIGNIPRHVTFPDGSKCETRANDELDSYLTTHNADHKGLVHRLESRWPVVLAAMVAVVGLSLVFYRVGIPFMAERVAMALPDSVNDAVTQQTIRFLDSRVVTRSTLSDARRAEIRGYFNDITREVGGATEYRLEFRGGGRMGPNAVALPGGVALITDDLLDLVEDDREIIAVLAHEVGHVVKRHSLRGALQNSAFLLLMVTLTGDIASASGAAATLPVVLASAKYSREFEFEADAFAYAYLQKHDISLAHLTNLLARMEERMGKDDSGSSFFSSHPATELRAAAAPVSFRTGAGNPDSRSGDATDGTDDDVTQQAVPEDGQVDDVAVDTASDPSTAAPATTATPDPVATGIDR